MAWKIPLFSAEVAAGLADKIRSNNSVAYAMAAQLADHPEHFKLSKRALSAVGGKVKATNLGQPDLHYLNTILVTTGVNKNDDYFERMETWAARSSPEDKPFNYEHVGDDIIGHITSCHVVDKDQKVVADDTVADSLPEKFHIVTSAVLYKFWEDESLQERMDNILTEISKGMWYVSMEALFKGFDYLLIGNTTQGSENKKVCKVVARQPDTAFLTKHLRAYGGNGVYQNWKVCRFLRNITFSGKGLVRKPANPESIIFSETETFNVNASAICGNVEELGYESNTIDVPQVKEQERTMAVDNNELTLATVKNENNSLRAEVETLKATLKEYDTKTVKAQIDGLTGEINGLKSKLEASEQKVKASADEAVTLKAQLATAQKEAEDTKAELAKIKAEQVTTVRVAMLMTALGEDEDKAKAEVEKLKYLSDEDFKAHADYLSEKLAAFKQASNQPSKSKTNNDGTQGKTLKVGSPKLPPKETNKPAPMGGHPPKVKTLAAEQDDADVNANSKNLEDVEVEEEPALATETADDGVEKVRADVAKFMGGYFGLPDEEAEETTKK
jgi:hypothetical protein